MDIAGVPNFIEVNPLAGLNPVHSDLPILARKYGISYYELLKMIMQSALQRLNIPFKIENGIFSSCQL
jgi:D-alanine-D-alanine ligase